MIPWDVSPGSVVVRRELQARYGGRQQGGIGPSRVTPNVLLFTDPATGHKHGYFDGWGSDGCYHYAGEGQLGDQRMAQGNLAILNHEADGRALRLFRAVPGGQEYLGEFKTDEAWPYYLTDAPETNGGPLRTVIMFRLRPVGEFRQHGPAIPVTPGSQPQVDNVDVEEQHTERTFVAPDHEPFEAERREAKLVRAYRDHLRGQGKIVHRHKITPPGEQKPLFTDLYDVDRGELLEAKGTTTREAIRMAVGQLLDYRRFLPQDTKLALLVPDAVRQDLLSYCHSYGIGVIWPHGGQWERREAGARDLPVAAA
ncbi:MAG: restriction endonuclease [Actinomycetota bacterium]|nr:restriction endonuclease [Actinomycetota bacterium]